LRSDFIWAPHIRFLYASVGDSLINLVRSELESGTFHPGIPLTIEVPKSFRIKVTGTQSKRLGPSFSRPGSVLPPKDRLLYQVIADEAAPIVEDKTDKNRSFSHRLANESEETMFLSTRKCWSELQKALKMHSAKKDVKYILRVDVADYFGSINQHTLINTLKAHNFDSRLADRLEKMLLSYTGQRSSRGILQGVYPSDLFGACYMSPVDRFFDDMNILSARYVDDIYVFVGSVDDADKALRKLIPFLRSYDLSLNEVKSTVMPKSVLFAEEPDLEGLFSKALSEISEQLDEEDTDTDYGFQKDWDDDDDASDDDGEDLELEATKALFDSINVFPGHEESIERFCLPLFTKAESDCAVNYVLEQLQRRPSMTQIYAAYLGKFVNDDDAVRKALVEALDDPGFFDWQKMWIVATLMQAKKASDRAVKIAMSLLIDANHHDALRAVVAMFVGKYGDHDRRKALVGVYKTASEYVQLAIYFASRSWPTVERKTARSSWGGHGQLHKLMSEGLASLKD
jgi:Reverse transcriptase (RNA-dependent DNA polymerase)